MNSSINFTAILCRKLLLKNKISGETRPLSITIGMPYWKIVDEVAACPVEILGLTGRAQDIVGIDPMHALELAFRFVQLQLQDFPQSIELTWPNGEPFGLSG